MAKTRRQGLRKPSRLAKNQKCYTPHAHEVPATERAEAANQEAAAIHDAAEARHEKMHLHHHKHS